MHGHPRGENAGSRRAELVPNFIPPKRVCRAFTTPETGTRGEFVPSFPCCLTHTPGGAAPRCHLCPPPGKGWGRRFGSGGTRGWKQPLAPPSTPCRKGSNKEGEHLPREPNLIHPPPAEVEPWPVLTPGGEGRGKGVAS